jgi:ankyrin repeat protein
MPLNLAAQLKAGALKTYTKDNLRTCLKTTEKHEFSELLQSKSPDKKTLLHYAAREGLTSEIPKEFITKELLLDKDQEDNTPLHEAAAHLHLDKIPEIPRIEEYLKIPNKKGETPIHLAATSDGFHQISWETFLKNLNLTTKAGTSVLQILTYHGKLPAIPQSILSEKQLLKQDNLGQTSLHYALKEGLYPSRCRGSLSHFPKSLLRPDVLNTKCFLGKSIYHLAAQSQEILNIENHAWSEKILLTPDTSGYNLIETCALANTLEWLPHGFISFQSLQRLIPNDPAILYAFTPINKDMVEWMKIEYDHALQKEKLQSLRRKQNHEKAPKNHEK